MTNENDDYKVGYGRPPLHTRFRKGESGNRKGRKKGQGKPSISLRELLDEMQVVQIAGRKIKMTKGEILLRKQLEKAMQGDPRSMKFLIEVMSKNGMIDWTMAPAFDFAGAKQELERRIMKLTSRPAGIVDSEHGDDEEK